MKQALTIIGVLLILFGIVAFAYQGFSYTTPEKVVQIGDLQVTAEKEKVVYFPPLLCGLSLVAGVVLVVVARMSKK